MLERIKISACLEDNYKNVNNELQDVETKENHYVMNILVISMINKKVKLYEKLEMTKNQRNASEAKMVIYRYPNYTYNLAAES